MTQTTATCPHCGEPVGAADEFCESCGNDLNGPGPAAPEAPAAGEGLDQPPPAGSPAAEVGDQSARTHLITPPGATESEPAGGGEPVAAGPEFGPCASCGGEVGADGWCTVCGARAANGRDHVVEQPSPTVAGVSDRGKVHTRNEDSCALAADGDWAALVVCDGVTSSTDSDVASLAAARAARDVLVAARRPSDADPAGRDEHWSQQLKAAAEAGGEAATAAAQTVGNSDNPPSCTFVAAVADGEVITAAWVGDSRAYWLADDGAAEQLSVDDSWATEQVRHGVVKEVAEADSRAHAITRWLGVDAPEVDAPTATTTAPGPGWLLVCSDGLWNYCSGASELAHLLASQAGTPALTGDQEPGDTPAGVRQTGPALGDDPLALSEALVDWANRQGGHDNITVTLARIVPVAGTATPSSEGAS